MLALLICAPRSATTGHTLTFVTKAIKLCERWRDMGNDLRKFALRLKVIEMLSLYHRAREHRETMEQWKRWLITPN